MDIGLMIEGQNGLTWERWIHILGLAERLKFPSVFRSDHFFIGTQQDSLEAYMAFAREFLSRRGLSMPPSPTTSETSENPA